MKLEIFAYNTYTSADTSQIWNNGSRFYWNTTGLPQGVYQYQWIANDSVNNIARFGNFTYIVDVGGGSGLPSGAGGSETVEPEEVVANNPNNHNIIDFNRLIGWFNDNPFTLIILLLAIVVASEVRVSNLKTKRKNRLNP